MRAALYATSLVLLLFGLPAIAADGDVRRITVSGQGEADAVPDIASLSIGVETQAETPGDALAENAKRMAAVMARLKEAGIADEDLQTSQLSIWPVYGDRQEQPEAVAFRASNQLTVTIRAIERLGELLDTAVADGANSVNGPSFSVADPTPLLEAARDAAIADAIGKAERYAKAANVTLGPVLSIEEAGAAPVVQRHARMQAAAASTPIAPGESTFSASVTMTFAIESGAIE